MRKILALFLLLGTIFSGIFALDFPQLSGRVVDSAQILNQSTKDELEQILANFEQNSSTQVVVTTINSLQNKDIESYANELARAWGIGQKGKDNGVLLLVAPNERKVRIEVGYGLEGEITDAIASLILEQTILPKFRQNNYDAGVKNGIANIIAAASGAFEASQDSSSEDLPFSLMGALFGFALTFLGAIFKSKTGKQLGFSLTFSGLLATFINDALAVEPFSFMGIGLFVCIFALIYMMISSAKPRQNHYTDDENDDFGSGINGGFGSRSSRGGGFRGGGGGFGGGGSSGSW
ncbi:MULTISPECIES: TPM domain-containing protein [unclassified Campylobacter]|uniref:TPM domain-containing protein n=1 Tax=unclassified Campylobacter TaxID=2593542 RepID=UPI003D34FE22